MNSLETGKKPTSTVKRVEHPPYVVDPSELRRFNKRNIIFRRVKWDSAWAGYQQMYDEKVFNILLEGKAGYSRVDFALAYASWIVHDAFEGGVSWTKIKPYRPSACTVGIDWTKTKCTIEDPRKMSMTIKRAARLLGASSVGVCRLNRAWLYADVAIPEDLENVIVLATEMDAKGISASPAVPAAVATGVGYSRMTFILAILGEFIRNLGFRALQCGNDTALSIPLAIDAGLGEIGRNGLLITPRYGPRVRLCKIITDLPMEPDKPIEFGVNNFCKRCRRCAEHCEAKAISMDNEPSFHAVCRSNNPGALKWSVDVERCYLFWCENGTDCSTCIKVCPYTADARAEAAALPKENETTF